MEYNFKKLKKNSTTFIIMTNFSFPFREFQTKFSLIMLDVVEKWNDLTAAVMSFMSLCNDAGNSIPIIEFRSKKLLNF